MKLMQKGYCKLPTRTVEVQFTTSRERSVMIEADVQGLETLQVRLVHSDGRKRTLQWRRKDHPKFWIILLDAIDNELVTPIQIFET